MILSDTTLAYALGIDSPLDDERVGEMRAKGCLNRGIGFGDLEITPMGTPSVHVQPSSYDLRLGASVTRFERPLSPAMGPVLAWEGVPERHLIRETSEEGGVIVVGPGEFLLGHTLENVKLPPYLTARVEGRSSIGRLGVTMHVTAGYIDPGFDGQITLEIVNLSKRAVHLRVGDRCCQLVVETMTTSALRPYGEARGSRFVGANAQGAVPVAKGPKLCPGSSNNDLDIGDHEVL